LARVFSQFSMIARTRGTAPANITPMASTIRLRSPEPPDSHVRSAKEWQRNPTVLKMFCRCSLASRTSVHTSPEPLF